MMYKKVLIVLMTLITAFCLGCTNNSKSSVADSSSSELVKIKCSDMDTPYTICYKNPDNTYSMYIYAAPIQFFDGKEYRMIDNTLIESSNDNYAFENKANSIKTYYPQNIDDKFLIKSNNFQILFELDIDGDVFSCADLTEYTNIYNQRIEAIKYAGKEYSLYFYTSNAGIEMETVSNNGLSTSIPIIIDYDSKYRKSRENYNNGYICLRKGNGFNDIDSIIFAPIYKDDSGYKPILEPNIAKQNNKWSISYDLVPNTSCINQSIVLYTSNMPDSCAYSNSYQNQYLSRFAFIGNTKLLGEGIDYLRYRLDYYLYLDPKKVINASYNLKTFGKADSSKIIVNENLDQWSSSALSWNNRNTKFAPINTSCYIDNNNYCTIDITDYAKKCFADETWMTESYGITLGYDGDAITIATSDNAMFVPYLQIDLSDLPEAFNLVNDINPDNEVINQ